MNRLFSNVVHRMFVINCQCYFFYCSDCTVVCPVIMFSVDSVINYAFITFWVAFTYMFLKFINNDLVYLTNF